MESSIPDYMVRERTEPLAMPPNWTPPYPAYSARYDKSVKTVVVAYLGVQHRGPVMPLAGVRAMTALRESTTKVDGPAHRDSFRFVDTSGYTNVVNALYWVDFEAYRRWAAENLHWTDPDRLTSKDVGFYMEVATPSFDRLETLTGGPEHSMEGLGVPARGLSDEMQEHGYWGGARDRMPLAQTDPMHPAGSLEFKRDGDLVIVVPHENMCTIRSDQNWAHMTGKPRERYLEMLEPVLAAGMQFLEDEGTTIGCYCHRYVRGINDEGVELEKAFGTGWWRSLADLEKWAESHPTHLKIFGSFQRYFREFGGMADLRMWHEVVTVAANQARFEYLGCHDRTGLLNASPRP